MLSLSIIICLLISIFQNGHSQYTEQSYQQQYNNYFYPTQWEYPNYYYSADWNTAPQQYPSNQYPSNQYPSNQYANTNSQDDKQQNALLYYNYSPYSYQQPQYPEIFRAEQYPSPAQANNVVGNQNVLKNDAVPSAPPAPAPLSENNRLPQFNEYVFGGNRPVIVTTQTSDGTTPTKEINVQLQDGSGPMAQDYSLTLVSYAK